MDSIEKREIQSQAFNSDSVKRYTEKTAFHQAGGRLEVCREGQGSCPWVCTA